MARARPPAPGSPSESQAGAGFTDRVSPGGKSQTDGDQFERAAKQAVRREEDGRVDPEPSPVARLGQIGVLGWTIVVPTLLCLFLGRWLDRRFATGIFFSAPLLMAGAAIGFWLAWRWMQKQV